MLMLTLTWDIEGPCGNWALALLFVHRLRATYSALFPLQTYHPSVSLAIAQYSLFLHVSTWNRQRCLLGRYMVIGSKVPWWPEVLELLVLRKGTTPLLMAFYLCGEQYLWDLVLCLSMLPCLHSLDIASPKQCLAWKLHCYFVDTAIIWWTL